MVRIFSLRLLSAQVMSVEKSPVIVGATVELTVIVLALLYYFREWIFSPLRELQGGVARVHAGDSPHEDAGRVE